MSVQSQEETEKLYYSISEVSQLFDINASTIRFYEKEFNLKPTKNKKGNRLFTRKDIESLYKIVDLVKSKGYTLQGAKEQLKKFDKSSQEEVKQQVIERLLNIKAQLLKIKDHL
ncbi:MAG: MerR family transcriptional regulator [Bacteroidota bacterium]|nr:MerR family transcriptional regulator [Bacteroidota bacterium]